LVFALLGALNAFFLSTAGLTLYIRALLLNRDLAIVGTIGILALFVLIVFGARRVIDRIQRLWISEDGGQSVPLRTQIDWRVSLGVTALWLILALGGMIALPRSASSVDNLLRPMVAATGVATGVLYIALGRSLQIGRFVRVGAIRAALSAALVLLPTGLPASWAASDPGCPGRV